MENIEGAPRSVQVACDAFTLAALKVPHIYAVASAIVSGAACTAAGVCKTEKTG